MEKKAIALPALILLRFVCLLVLSAAHCVADINMAFTVSMPQPASHMYQISLRCEGLSGELHDFKLPQWSPGYYGIRNYARNVSHFRAEDASGHELGWEKVTRNAWRVVASSASTIMLDYDVFAASSFPADSYLGEDRGFISPASIFVNIDGQIQQRVTIHIQVPAAWHRIATGLERVAAEPNTFEAPNFDVLYDCPILMGNPEYLQFEVRRVPHFVAIENVPAEVSRDKMLADLKAIVTAATDLMGDVPYKQYTFLMMGRGGGGIEHSNSSANQFDGKSLTTPAGYLRWLSFISHEYFHNFNVKRIRPLALGPFDYEQENLTNMLWVSEGLSVYYEDLVLVRAGLLTRDQYLAKMASAVGAFENTSGRHYQSATEASQNAWNSGSGVGGDRNLSISYYNNGAMLGAMLDLKIRASTGNRKSLDDVMRGMYRKYYLQRQRGFTDAEFRAECEGAAGASLAEIFEYASSAKEMDYARYFALAGLKLDATSEEAPGGYIGLDTRTEEIPPSEAPIGVDRQLRGGRGGSAQSFKLLVTDVATHSAAETAGIKPGDRILEVDGTAATAKVLNDAINAKTPGQEVRIHIERSGRDLNIPITVARNAKKTFQFVPAAEATSEENRILETWLGKAR